VSAGTRAALRWLVGALAATLIASAGAFAADPSGVTFENQSTKPVQVTARFGGAGACTDLARGTEFTLLPGESQSVDSGAERVCYCDRGIANSPATCSAGWKEARPGSHMALRLGSDGPFGVGAGPGKDAPPKDAPPKDAPPKDDLAKPGGCSGGWCDIGAESR
jgi:hypothetical protein